MTKVRPESEFAVRVGRRVASVRRARGWSQARLAQELGVEPSTLSRLETGKRPFGLALLHRVATRLGMSPAALLDEEAPRHSGLAPDEEALLGLWRSLGGRAQGTLLAVARELAAVPVDLAAEREEDGTGS